MNQIIPKMENVMSEGHSSKVSQRTVVGAGLGIALLAALLVAQGLWSRHSAAKNLEQLASSAEATPVIISVPSKGAASSQDQKDNINVMELPGRIEAFSKASLFARVSGYLKAWHVDIGTPVKAGQLMAEIDTPDLDQQIVQAQAELASAKANANLAQSTAKRWASLQDQNFVSPQAADEKMAEAGAKVALANASQANLDRLKLMKNFARIVAPFDGVVTARQTDVGALINVGGAAGTELFTVSDTQRLRLYVNVPQNLVSAIKAGTQATFTVPEYPGQIFKAQVQSLSQAINTGTATMLVQFTALNPLKNLLPGGTATVQLSLPESDALRVPPSALMFSKEGLRIATVGEDMKVVLKPVKIARDFGTSVEIASGLLPTDRIIESPPDGLLQGDLVRAAATNRP
jgi:RND family efflux transporter MFP subunit